ncbi:MAG: hypothetical protein SXG53_24570 [Pseudomonadota bacterium]|nr:hypothetical protein [Pseudomonadota bacterium]
MDEYLFMTLARLKADRFQLQREQHAVGPHPEQLPLELADTLDPRRAATPRAVRTSVLTRWFSQQPSWREQS